MSLQFALEKYAADFSGKIIDAREKADFLLSEISEMEHFEIVPKTRNTGNENFSPYVLQIAHAHIAGEVMVRVLSDRGIFVSTGSACSSAKTNRPVLQAMRVQKAVQLNAFRVSLGNETTYDELRSLVKALTEVDAEFSV